MHGQVFDFIIVGAGASGAVVAARLSENPKYRVLLVEAGGWPGINTVVPYNRSLTYRHSETDWEFQTVPQKYGALSQAGRKINIIQGKVLGGSANINGMAYQRGNPRDYNKWARLTGDRQYTYKNLLPFFKKIETYTGSFPKSKDHGYRGPIEVSEQQYAPLQMEWIETGKWLGFPYNDPNTGAQSSGFIPSPVNIRKGKRSSPYQEYLKVTAERPNLTILSNAYVTKINFAASGVARAEGVTFTRHQQVIRVFARNEVILSAGVIKTPHLLMLSGVGDKDHLKEFGIDVKAHLPGVGQGLNDHVTTIVGPFLFTSTNKNLTFLPSRDLKPEHYTQYEANGSGPFASTFASGVGFWSSEGNHDWPNIEFEQISLGGGGVSRVHPYIPGIENYDRLAIGRDAVSIILNLGRQYSRGTVTLNSSDPYVQPNIDPNYYSHPRDLRNMVKAMDFIVKFYEESPFYKPLGAHLISTRLPGCEGHRPKSKAYYRCYLRHLTFTGFHLGSSCKMGKDNDDMAVVDTRMRVRGVDSLRIVDASVMPDIPNSNTNAAAIMIGEKGADLIKADWSIK